MRIAFLFHLTQYSLAISITCPIHLIKLLQQQILLMRLVIHPQHSEGFLRGVHRGLQGILLHELGFLRNTLGFQLSDRRRER